MNFVRLAQYPAPARLGCFVLSLLLLWLPVAAPIYLLLSKDPNLVTILTMGLLFAAFLLLVRWWGQKVYQQPHLLRSYGLQGTRQNAKELFFGLGIGGLITFSLFGLEGLLGWLVWQPATIPLPKLILEGLASALGIGFAEELVFRGWLLDELERDYRPRVSLLADAFIFALLHFLKPLREIFRTLPGFPGLLLLGLTLVWAKRRSKGRLGLSIGLHAGLVWGYYMINVGNLVQFSGRVSDWITGVDKNPLAGVIGLVFLSVLAFGMRSLPHSLRSPQW
ncbi:CPBP family intramembrane glutamic endopeptidase [Coleofasciculus sp. H7-2]|uniref:CPBP family intramembrane glutamic endopeptidase n=1 Tax=Coleofasciculus sp. H7-2 TaxID=3351545 RepID=UPI00366D4EBD